MAKVHLARKDGSNDIVVLKQLHVQLESNSEAGRRFHREANIASQLNHTGICQVTDAGVEGERFCLAMEFIAGETVEGLIQAAQERGGVLPFEVSIPIMLEALEALAYAHEFRDAEGTPLNLVHRDLSPRNVMVSYTGQVKLIDFGIAKGNIDEYKTAAGTLIGTPYYMSPEQATATAIDQRSDIYSIAVVFWEMLVGERLVSAKGRAKILMSVARDLAPAPSVKNVRVPTAFDAVLLKALSKDAEDRYANAREFKAALAKAGKDYLSTPRDSIGQFVRALFPNGEKKSAELLSRAAAHALDGPVAEPTRIHTGELTGYARPSDQGLSDLRLETKAGMTPEDLHMQTKTGYLSAPEQVGTGMGVIVSDALVQTNTRPMVVPTVTHFGNSSYSGSSTLTQVRAIGPKTVGLVALALLTLFGALFVLYDRTPTDLEVHETALGDPNKTPTVQARANSPGVQVVQTQAPAPEESPTEERIRRPEPRRNNEPRSEGRAEAPPPPPPAPPPPTNRQPTLRSRLNELRRLTGDDNNAMKLGRALAKDVIQAAETLPPDSQGAVTSEAIRARDRALTPEQQLEALESAISAFEKNR